MIDPILRYRHTEYHEAIKGIAPVAERHGGYLETRCRICGELYLLAIGAPNPSQTCGMAECERIAEALHGRTKP